MIKKILVLGLLLIPCFSFARDDLILPGNGFDMGNSNYCSVNSDLSFSCSETNNIFQSVGIPARGNFSTSYWWNNEGLGFYKYSSTNSDCSLQGVVTGFAFCEYDFVGNNSLRINNSMYWSDCFSKTYTYGEFSQYISSHQLKYWSPVNFSTINGYAGLVFVFDDGAFRTQFDVGASNICNNFMYGNYGLRNYGLVGLTPDFTNLNIINRPAGVSVPLPDYSIEPGQCVRNGDAMLGFEYLGLSKQLCYGGFDLSDLYVESERFSDWTGYNYGGGVSIFQLHNAYSGGLTMKPFLSSYYQSYLNGQVSNFYNKSKGLFMFIQQYYSSYNLDSSSFKLNDLIDYCDLYFDLYNNNYDNDKDCYTGGNKDAIDSYNLNKNLSGSNNGGFSFTGVLGGNGTGFSTPDEFFGRLSNLFQTNMRGIDLTFPSMIPSYIVFFMLAIILIRIISH